MKIIHTADLHIGKFGALEAQREVLQEIIEYCKQEQPNAVIIAGDIYDAALPSPKAVLLFDWFLTNLREVVPCVMIISGNHDSPERLSYASKILRMANVFISAKLEEKVLQLTLTDEYGDIDFTLMPFLRPSTVRKVFPEFAGETYSDAINFVLKTEKSQRRNVLVAHQYFTAKDYTPQFTDETPSMVKANEWATLPENFDYIALGHMHIAQNIAPNARFAGSILPYTPLETETKTITVVELFAKGERNLRFLPLKTKYEIKKDTRNLIFPKEKQNEIGELKNGLVMFIGKTASGKTKLAQEKLNNPRIFTLKDVVGNGSFGENYLSSLSKFIEEIPVGEPIFIDGGTEMLDYDTQMKLIKVLKKKVAKTHLVGLATVSYDLAYRADFVVEV